MKKILFCILIVFVPIVVLAGPVLIMPTQKVVLDQYVVSGNSAQVIFPIKNNGDSELEVLKVVTDCGCAAAYFDRIIAPGRQGRIELVIDTEGLSGWIKKRAMVKTNDPHKKALMIEAELGVYPVDSGDDNL